MRIEKWAVAAGAFYLSTVGLTATALAGACPGNPNALSTSRVVQIDTTGGPGFGFQHYKFYDFLQDGEVVLTFDDGPLPTHTVTILKALKAHCARATFFPVGKLAVGYPEVLRRVRRDGHTIGSHTWSHKNLASKKMSIEKAKIEIEKAMSGVKLALGAPGAPFFRFPFLRDTPEAIKYLGSRNQAVFSTDLDSFDFRGGRPSKLISRVMRNLKKQGKGILLFHDIQPVTAKAMPALLRRLKKDGYRLVHLTAKEPTQTLARFDEEVKKSFKGRGSMAARPLSSVVTTVDKNQ